MSSTTQPQTQAVPCTGFYSCKCPMPNSMTHTWMGQNTPTIVSHYKESCKGCYSCEWLKSTARPLVPDPVRVGVMIPNTRNQKVTPEAFQMIRTADRFRGGQPLLRYVYPKRVGGIGRWIAVPCKPFLPFLLPQWTTQGIDRFVRHEDGNWVGLGKQGSNLAPYTLRQDSRPPMVNELYEWFGYLPSTSPYLPPKHQAYSDGRANGLWNPEFGTVYAPDVANDGQCGPINEVAWDDAHTNTTIFVGCLAAWATEQDLLAAFGAFGEIVKLRVFPPARASPIKNGFVYFYRRRDAEMALEQLQGLPICGNRVRLSWGTKEDWSVLWAWSKDRIRASEAQTSPEVSDVSETPSPQ
ncbi:hypothetical protein VMCG_03118 [Cytospora schulzeri]|uniref:RRM domain-containing protein n=1 Tax=Cytospora schulzeri TaxID=448051 RepID=A0A423WXK6_9PEZI|nr:hypothetical protein VMCG_03118 [Valsa malicola]